MTSELEKRLKQRMLGVVAGQPWDESREREADGYLAAMAVWNFWLVTVLMLVSLLFDTWRHTLSFGTFALLGVQQFSAIYIIVRMRRSGSFDYQASSQEDLQQALRKLKKSTAVMGAFWGVAMLLVMNVMLPLVAGNAVKVAPIHVLIWLVGGAFFGAGMYFIQKGRFVKALQTGADQQT